MYGVLNHELQIIAVHDEKEIIRKFIEQEKIITDIVKIKKKSISKYNDLYLIKCGEKYVPYYLFETYKETSMEYTYELENCKDVLFTLLEDMESKKDIKAISRVLYILENEINKRSDIDVNSLKEIKELNDEYRNKVNDDVEKF